MLFSRLWVMESVNNNVSSPSEVKPDEISHYATPPDGSSQRLNSLNRSRKHTPENQTPNHRGSSAFKTPQESPYHQTPNSSGGRYNPFEADLPERLKQSCSTPSIFSKVVSPSEKQVNLLFVYC